MRKPRQTIEDGKYHVTARANRQEMIMQDDKIKELFYTTVARAKKKYSFSIENICIMGNHFHLIIKPGKGESISKIMQWIMSVFAMAYNKLLNIHGHVWGERFFSRIIARFREFYAIFYYLDDNPVNAGLVYFNWEWHYGGISWHRTCQQDVVQPIPLWMLASFPHHQQLCLPNV